MWVKRASQFVLFTAYYYGDQIKEDGRGGAYRTHGMFTKNLIGKRKSKTRMWMVDIKEVYVDWIHPAHHTARCWAVVKTVMSIRFPQNVQNF
jgi:hypothetical protein